MIGRLGGSVNEIGRQTRYDPAVSLQRDGLVPHVFILKYQIAV